MVNNAGIAVNAPVETAPLDEWRKQFEVSVIGQIAATQALIPALLASGGRVINIGSVGGRIAMPGFGPYSAAKFAMEAVTDALRREIEQFGVKVVMITPGAVKTNMSDQGIKTADRLAAAMTPTNTNDTIDSSKPSRNKPRNSPSTAYLLRKPLR